MERIKHLLDNFYHLVNNSQCFKYMTASQCYEKAQTLKEKIKVLKEEFKENPDLYNLLTEFCNKEYTTLGWKKVEKDEKD
jgi:uncharacterized protein YgiM (DUF1202 family)